MVLMLARDILAQLRAVVGPEGVQSEPAELVAYSYDATFQQRLPDAIVHPASTEQVSAILKLASLHGLPVVPRGSGTSLAGGTVPFAGGIVLNLAQMNRILEVDPATTTATVQAGVINAQLQHAAEPLGLFYPPDPASLAQCTLGGNIACNAGGPRCLKYGVTKDYVLGLTVVLMDGRVLRLGGKLLKNATGYQLIQLFIGSEGTLGVVTEIILRLLPLPRARATAAAVFPTLDAASRAVTSVLSSGLLPATMELMDGVTLNAVEDFAHVGLPREAGAMLIIEQDGHDQASVGQEVEEIAAICRAQGALQVDVATEAVGRARLWAARRAASGALGQLRPNKLGEDIVVPRNQIPEMVRRIGEIAGQFGLVIAVFGHAGDGNLHPNILFDRRQPGELERVEQAAEAIFRAALALGGTLSGEHGVGSLKREFLRDALGDAPVDLMLAVKRLFDPQGLLNPGKLFPTRSGPDHTGFLTSLPTLDNVVTG
jgi:glycolate oxidase